MLKEAPLRPLKEQLRLLVLHIRSGHHGLLVVAVPDADAEQMLAEETRRWLGDGASIEEVRLAPEPVERLSLSHHLSTLPLPSRYAAVFVFGLDDLPAAARTTAINAMNWGRERLRATGYTVVLWVRPGTPGELGNRAPDFFSWRSDVFQFALPDDPAEREGVVARLRLFADADLAEIGQRYREYVVDACRWLDSRGFLQVRNIVRLPFDELFVAPDLTTAVDEVARPFPPLAIETAGFEAGGRLMRPVARRVPLDVAVRQAQHLVILGDPGSGKSTALRFLALTYAQGRARVRERLGIDEDRLPVLVPLSAFAEARTRGGELTIEEFLPAYLRTQGLPDLTGLFASALATGRMLLLLDGLDEMFDVGGRAEVGRAIDDFVVAHDDVRVVVSSRIAGFQRGVLVAGFSVFTIAPLDREGIKRFAANWTRAFEAAGLERPAVLSEDAAWRADRRAESLVAAATSHPGVRQLATNPLMLTLLALVHQQGTRLPNRRADLYRLCVEALAETWNLARSLSGRPIDIRLGERRLDEDFVVRLLAPIAYWVHERRPTGMISAAELIAKIAAEFKDQDGVEGQEAERLARGFVRLAREQMGLLVERASEIFAFVHLTIQEYLAARFLSERHDVFARVRPLMHDPRWAEIVRLTASILRGDHAATFVEQIIRARVPREEIAHRLLVLQRRGTSPGEPRTVSRVNQRLREIVRTLLSLLDVRLGADCIAEEVMTPPELRRWTTQFVLDRWLETAVGRHHWQPVLAKLGRDVAHQDVEAATLRVLLDRNLDDNHLRSDAARTLSEINPRPETAHALFNVLSSAEEPAWLRSVVARALGQVAHADDEIRTRLREIFCDPTREAAVRGFAAEAMGEAGRLNDGDVRTLLGMLGDRRLRANIRAQTARALGRIGLEHADAAAALLAVIRDPGEDPMVRATSALAASDLPDIVIAAAPELLELLASRREDLVVRLQTMFTLARRATSQERFRGTLLNIVRAADEDPLLRGAAADFLIETDPGNPEIRRVLLLLAGDKRTEAGVRYGAAYAFCKVAAHDGAATGILINFIRDEDFAVRLAAVNASARLWREGDEIVRALCAALDDEFLHDTVLSTLFWILSDGGLPKIEQVTGRIDGDERRARSSRRDQR